MELILNVRPRINTCNLQMLFLLSRPSLWLSAPWNPSLYPGMSTCTAAISVKHRLVLSLSQFELFRKVTDFAGCILAFLQPLQINYRNILLFHKDIFPVILEGCSFPTLFALHWQHRYVSMILQHVSPFFRSR